MQALALAQAILGAVQKGKMLAADAMGLFREAGISDAELVAIDASYAEMIATWDQRATPDAEP